MRTDEEWIKEIDRVSAGFSGSYDDLQAAIGAVMVGRLYGWRVVRLAGSRRHWTLACSLFGDLKEILQPETPLSQKSMAYRIVTKAENYWDVVKGKTDAMPLHERKLML